MQSLQNSEGLIKTVPCSLSRGSFGQNPTGEALSDITLPYTADELSEYVSGRLIGLAQASRIWIERAAKKLWQTTLAIIS